MPQSALEKNISDTFSQPSEIYKIAIHPKGGMELALKMGTIYSVKQMYNVLEILEVYDAIEASRPTQ